jgi:hypothetical protein
MHNPNHIIYVDNKEEIVLLDAVLREIDVKLHLHTFQQFSGAEEFLNCTNITPNIVLVGSSVILRESEVRMMKFVNEYKLNAIPLLVFIQTELCNKYLIKNHIPNLQFIMRPFELEVTENPLKIYLIIVCIHK